MTEEHRLVLNDKNLDDFVDALQQNILNTSKSPLFVRAEQDWVPRLKKLREKVLSFPSTLIGVFGNTRNGKSSLINALLDNKELLEHVSKC